MPIMTLPNYQPINAQLAHFADLRVLVEAETDVRSPNTLTQFVGVELGAGVVGVERVGGDAGRGGGVGRVG